MKSLVSGFEWFAVLAWRLLARYSYIDNDIVIDWPFRL